MASHHISYGITLQSFKLAFLPPYLTSAVNVSVKRNKTYTTGYQLRAYLFSMQQLPLSTWRSASFSAQQPATTSNNSFESRPSIASDIFALFESRLGGMINSVCRHPAHTPFLSAIWCCWLLLEFCWIAVCCCHCHHGHMVPQSKSKRIQRGRWQISKREDFKRVCVLSDNFLFQVVSGQPKSKWILSKESWARYRLCPVAIRI